MSIIIKTDFKEAARQRATRTPDEFAHPERQTPAEFIDWLQKILELRSPLIRDRRYRQARQLLETHPNLTPSEADATGSFDVVLTRVLQDAADCSTNPTRQNAAESLFSYLLDHPQLVTPRGIEAILGFAAARLPVQNYLGLLLQARQDLTSTAAGSILTLISNYPFSLTLLHCFKATLAINPQAASPEDLELAREVTEHFFAPQEFMPAVRDRPGLTLHDCLAAMISPPIAQAPPITAAFAAATSQNVDFRLAQPSPILPPQKWNRASFLHYLTRLAEELESPEDFDKGYRLALFVLKRLPGLAPRHPNAGRGFQQALRDALLFTSHPDHPNSATQLVQLFFQEHRRLFTSAFALPTLISRALADREICPLLGEILLHRPDLVRPTVTLTLNHLLESAVLDNGVEILRQAFTADPTCLTHKRLTEFQKHLYLRYPYSTRLFRAPYENFVTTLRGWVEDHHHRSQSTTPAKPTPLLRFEAFVQRSVHILPLIPRDHPRRRHLALQQPGDRA